MFVFQAPAFLLLAVAATNVEVGNGFLHKPNYPIQRSWWLDYRRTFVKDGNHDVTTTTTTTTTTTKIFASQLLEPQQNQVSATTKQQRQQNQKLHLFSLQHPSKKSITETKPFAKLTALLKEQLLEKPTLVKRTWWWKDEVLGRGIDMFVSRPETLAKFQRQLVDWSPNGLLKECSILSNCARLDLLCVVRDENVHRNEIEKYLNQVITYQMCHYETNCRGPLEFWLNGPNADRPDFLTDEVLDPITATTTTSVDTEEDSRLKWTHLTNHENILHHYCMIGAGFANRPNQPGAYIPYRPYSGLDAHVLEQLKRTLDRSVVEPTKESSSSSSGMIRIVLETALRAGKACRNAAIVPEIELLHAISRATTVEEQKARRAAYDKAVVPAMQDGLEKLTALRNAQQIQTFRDSVLAMAKSPQEVTWLKKQLHEPTLALRRQGSLTNADGTTTTTVVDVRKVCQEMKDKLNGRRSLAQS